MADEGVGPPFRKKAQKPAGERGCRDGLAGIFLVLFRLYFSLLEIGRSVMGERRGLRENDER